jgi:hypothetical protein
MSVNFDPKFVKFAKASTTTLLTSLQAYWKLDEPSGTIYDSTANDHDSTTNVCTYGLATKAGFGTCVGFAAATDYIQFPDSAGFDCPIGANLSINCWVYLTADLSHEGNLVGAYTGPQFFLSRTAVDTYRMKFYSGNTTDLGNTFVINQNTWTMLTMTKAGGTYNAYINGSIWASAVAGYNEACGDPICIGGDTGGEHIEGRIDEVGYWNKELTSTEVAELYNSGSGKTYPFS